LGLEGWPDLAGSLTDQFGLALVATLVQASSERRAWRVPRFVRPAGYRVVMSFGGTRVPDRHVVRTFRVKVLAGGGRRAAAAGVRAAGVCR
jgi:hypothetical protein